MDKELKKIVLAIIMVPVLVVVYIVAAMVSQKNDAEGMTFNYEDQAGGSGVKIDKLSERGYVQYKEMPLCVQNLVDLNLFSGSVEYGESEDSIVRNKYLELTGGTYLKTHSEFNVSERWDSNDFTDMTMDHERKNFTADSLDKISQIEACGFTGFSDLMEQVRTIIASRASENTDADSSYGEVFKIFCQGCTFEFNGGTHGETYSLGFTLNASSAFAPQKYVDTIKQITDSGEYSLYGSCVTGENDVLTFCKNNSISDLTPQVEHKQDLKAQNKKISFVYHEGKLIDYFVNTESGKLILDEADKAFIKKQTAGLNKELKDKSESDGSEDECADGFLLYMTK